MDKKQRIGLKARAVWSLFMFFSFLLLIPSGILLHVFSSGDFEAQQHVFMTVHNVCALIFVVSGTAHLVLNRKSVLSYMRSKTAEYRAFSRELILLALIFAALLTAALLHIVLLG
jgi:hypothetical protein